MERALLERIVFDTGCAERHGETVFLCDPHWSVNQQERFREIAGEARHAPTVSAKQHAAATPLAVKLRAAAIADEEGRECLPGWLAIPTGGSSGGLKFALHDERTLGTAVGGFCAHFGVNLVNAVDCLPPWHVSGLMARLRCAATGGVHLPWDWKRLEAGDFPELPKLPDSVAKAVGAASMVGAWFLSLVPTQLQRLLKQGSSAQNWLRGFNAIFIGGGPLWPSLADEAAAARLPIILSYGMTETAAMVTAQWLGDFAAGDRSSGVLMPHARISINDEGLVCVRGESVMRGYFGADPSNEVFTTADLGCFDEAGRLRVLGRRDEVAISGGEKVRLNEVESILRGVLGCDRGVSAGGDRCGSADGDECASLSEGRFEDLAVVAVPDPEWGEVVVACYVSTERGPLPQELIDRMTRGLARHQKPKQWLAFAADEWPRNAQGKLNRSALREAVLVRAKSPNR